MKNPKLLFAINILIIIYLGLIIFYMFNDFLMFEERHSGGNAIANVDKSDNKN